MRSPIPPLLALLATAPLLTPAMAGAQTTTRMRVLQEQPATGVKTLEALQVTPPPQGPPPQGITLRPLGDLGDLREARLESRAKCHGLRCHPR